MSKPEQLSVRVDTSERRVNFRLSLSELLRPKRAAQMTAALAAVATLTACLEAPEADAPDSTKQVVVEPGDDFWAIVTREFVESTGLSAEEVGERYDIGDEVDWAVEENGGSLIRPGELVTIIDIPDSVEAGQASQGAVRQNNMQP